VLAAHCFSLPHSGLSGAGKNSNREAERVGPLYEQGNGDSLITTTAENETAFVNKETLARRWKGDRV
jgi:hypothetical protein